MCGVDKPNALNFPLICKNMTCCSIKGQLTFHMIFQTPISPFYLCPPFLSPYSFLSISTVAQDTKKMTDMRLQHQLMLTNERIILLNLFLSFFTPFLSLLGCFVHLFSVQPLLLCSFFMFPFLLFCCLLPYPFLFSLSENFFGCCIKTVALAVVLDVKLWDHQFIRIHSLRATEVCTRLFANP